jgi:hypothetical protein
MGSRYANPDMWVTAADRAIQTAAATAVALVGSNLAGITGVNWPELLNVAAAAALVSLLTSIATAPRRG